MANNRYALLVGCNNYIDDTLPDLSAPINDVNQLHNVLSDPHIGNFEVDVLINEANDVVSRNIERFFKGRMPDDLLLLYFSCHGMQDSNRELYFAVKNSSNEFLQTSTVSAKFVMQEAQKSRSRSKILLLDCCYSGAFPKGSTNKASVKIDLQEQFEQGNFEQGRGLAVLTASDDRQYSMEDNSSNAESARSVFTGTVIDGLITGDADADKNGIITLNELYNYVFDRVMRQKRQQTPQMHIFGGEGNLVVANSPHLLANVSTLEPGLRPYSEAIQRRSIYFRGARAKFEQSGGLMGEISQGHHYYGFNRDEKDERSGLWYREWAPYANSLSLIGDFNGWDRERHPLNRDQWGVWSIFLPDEEYRHLLTHQSKIKVHVRAANGDLDRLPAYSKRLVQEEISGNFNAQYWMPPEPYSWKHSRPIQKRGLRIYETHVGIAQEGERIGTFSEFTQQTLPRIAELGYNAIQIMAVMEHPYYGSFGYQVANFYAVSSRFGTPEELKELIDTAHGMGLLVIMDLVHSHAVKNINEGLNCFDGTEFQYFHAGAKGQHNEWDSLCFDYAKYEVCRFLLSNIRFWMEEYHFDGFRFDAVTSMLYFDHGLNRTFSTYGDYFSSNVDQDAVNYLMLANELIHTLNKDAISIAEEVSGMVGLASKIEQGGIGFDYRLAMGVPDYWVKMLQEADEQWSMLGMYQALTNRRMYEKHIGYAESHDQAIVGNQTIAFRLMGEAMYRNMGKQSSNPVADRGVALHKMIRLITFSLAGDGYLNFMGNEFGHPDWVDLPREGNHHSYYYARRQWSLVERQELRYQGLNEFDQALNRLDEEINILSDPLIELLTYSDEKKLLVYRRGTLVFVCNFHVDRSYPHLRIPVPNIGDYKIVLDTDAAQFSGHNRIPSDVIYPLQKISEQGRDQSIEIYLPARCAQVLSPL